MWRANPPTIPPTKRQSKKQAKQNKLLGSTPNIYVWLVKIKYTSDIHENPFCVTITGSKLSRKDFLRMRNILNISELQPKIKCYDVTLDFIHL